MDAEQTNGVAEAVDSSTKKPRESLRLARSAMETSDWTAAATHFQAAAAEEPDNPKILKGLGRALRELGRAAEAETVYRRLLELDPTNVAAQLAVGRAEWDQGRRKEALAYLEAATASGGADPRLDLSLGAKLLTELRLDEAEAAFRRVIAVEPGNAAALQGLGRCAQFGGNPEEALEMFRAAVASDPGDQWSASAIRAFEADLGAHDWKSEVREAIAVLSAAESGREERLWAAKTLVFYGMTDLVEKELAPLEKTVPAARRLLQMARQLDRMGLSHPAGDPGETADPDADQLNGLTGFTERLNPGAETLVVVFSGAAHRAFLSLDVMHRILRTTGASLIYLRDLGRTRYVGGVVGLGDDLDSTVAAFRSIMTGAGARRLLMIGNCAGCAGALRYGLALGAQAVLGMSPRILGAVAMERRLKGLSPQGLAKLEAMRTAAGGYAGDLPSLYLGAAARPRVTLIAGAGMEPEASFARDMAARVPGVVSTEMPGVFKECLGDILARGYLSSLLSSFVAGGEVKPEILQALSRPAPEEAKARAESDRSGAEAGPAFQG